MELTREWCHKPAGQQETNDAGDGGDQWCKPDHILKTKTKTTGSKQMHLADLTFKKVNATVDLHSNDVPST